MYWKVITASVTGHGHIAHNIPCQDSLAYEFIDDHCGLAIIADGAGSCKNADIGSKFVADEGIKHFKKLILKHKWHKKLPNSKKWEKKVIATAFKVSKALRTQNEEYDYASLSSTLIVLFFTQKGICSLNIGDGRGAIKNTSGQWKSIVVPYHGEQVGMTVFLTSAIWKNEKIYISTMVKKEKIDAFIIMSDGCEKIAFECYTQDKAGIFCDPNKPYDNFLNFVLTTTKNFLKNNVSDDIIKEKWEKFLKNGHQILQTENDDKTMVFGFLWDNEIKNKDDI